MKAPVQKGVLIEFVFGNTTFRDGYTQIGHFKNESKDWPQIYITAPIEWVNANFANLDEQKDLLKNLTVGFINSFNKDKVDTSKDRFQYYLLNDDEDIAITLGYFDETEGGIFKQIDNLTAEESIEFQESRDKIGEFYRDTLWFSPIKENYERFCQLLQSVEQKFIKSGRPDYSGKEIVNINSMFNNFVASFTSYLNYMEKKLKNRDITCWDRYYIHTSGQYDKNISYRFIVGLRNYIQHQAPPIHIRYKSEFVEGKPIHQVDIYCAKEELLRSDSWNEIKRNDILSMDDLIDLSHHVDSMMDSLNQILKNHIQDEFADLSKSAKIIHNLLQRIPTGQDRGVYELHFVNNKIVSITPHLMYVNIVEAVIENDVYKIF